MVLGDGKQDFGASIGIPVFRASAPMANPGQSEACSPFLEEKMTDQRTTKPEEKIKDLAKEDKALSNDELGGVVGGVLSPGSIIGGKLPEETNVNFEAQTDGKWSPNG